MQRHASIEAISGKGRIAIFAGLREVRNYGIQIEISCSPESLIRDSVIRTFVNDLKALGAEAIAVNDERLVATSEIRATSTSIIINGKGYNRQDKFVIKAITDPSKEAYILSYLETLKKSVLSDAILRNDQYDIQFQPVSELLIPALSEDSLAFKIDLLMPESTEPLQGETELSIMEKHLLITAGSDADNCGSFNSNFA